MAGLILLAGFELDCRADGGTETPSSPPLAPPAAYEATFPLRVDGASRRLVGANNEPFLVVGDTAWSLIVQLTREETIQYLDDRKARGFNTLLVELIEHRFSSNPPANRYGQQPFLTPGDFSTPNAAYFDHAEWVIAQAAQRGLVVLLTPVYIGFPGSTDGWYEEVKANGTARCQQFGRYVGQRFRNYANIVWVHGGDSPPRDVLPQIEAVVAGIKEFDPDNIHTAHSVSERSALDDYDRPWLDLNTTYSRDQACNNVLTLSRNDWVRPGALTSFHIEGWYENDGPGTNQSCLLAQMYYPVLFGIRGHVFGNDPLWYFGQGWQAALNRPGTSLMIHSAALFRSREGWGLVPDINGTLVVSGAGNSASASDFAAAATTPSNSSVLVYVPTARTLGVDTARVPGSQFKAWWFNPRDGSAQSIGTFANGGTRSFTTPAGSPWVLVLDDTARALPPPGGGLAPLSRADILWRHASGWLYAWSMRGLTASGGYLSPASLTDSSWVARGLADFNGDGQADILWHHQRTGDLYVWLMNGTVAVGGAYLNPPRFADTAWQIQALGDLNGDGWQDLLWRRQATGELYTWLLSGTQTIGGGYLTPDRFADVNWRIRGLVDLNGDRRQDLLWHHQGTGDLYVWYLNGTRTTGGGYLPRLADTRWQVVRQADYNGDGQQDIVWSNRVTGTLYAWLMSGASVVAGAYLSPSSVDPAWEPIP